jgi:hypothetical protein
LRGRSAAGTIVVVDEEATILLLTILAGIRADVLALRNRFVQEDWNGTEAD